MHERLLQTLIFEDSLRIAYAFVGWHAMGFSSRAATAQPMIGSNVVFGCADFVNSGDGTFQAQDYFLGDKAASQVNPAVGNITHFCFPLL